MEYESRNQLGLIVSGPEKDDDNYDGESNPSGNTFGEGSGCSVQ